MARGPQFAHALLCFTGNFTPLSKALYTFNDFFVFFLLFCAMTVDDVWSHVWELYLSADVFTFNRNIFLDDAVI